MEGQRKKKNKQKEGGILRKNAKWNRGKSTIRHRVQKNGYKDVQWAHWELLKTTGKLQGTYCKLYQCEKGNRNYQQEPRGNEEYTFWIEEHSRRNQKQAWWSRGSNQWAGGQGRKKTPRKSKKRKKRLKRNEEGLKELKGNMKCNNIHIIIHYM